MLRGMLALEGQEMGGGWRNLCGKEVHDVCCYCSDDKICVLRKFMVCAVIVQMIKFVW